MEVNQDLEKYMQTHRKILFKDKPKQGLLTSSYEQQRMAAALGPDILHKLEGGDIPQDPELQAYVQSRLRTLKMKGK